MMSNSIITVEGLGKCYQIDHEKQQGYTALRDVLANKAKNLFKKGQTEKSVEDFWALKDVSFTIEQGDAVGIIGRNGAGKSTLLKLLSRITEPTTGKIILNGRVASLLEVGTGFHPELTGRENIFLNGAILGMSRREIRQKFDEIVDFSDVEKFLDTPVKRYSSGMYVRLAFAIAAHLEPEILVVDEVLAVGDAEFQKKCLGKMNEISHQNGRTVLFVSHNMGSVNQLCNKGILLNKGKVVDIDGIEKITSAYFNLGHEDSPILNLENAKRKGTGLLRFLNVRLQKNTETIPSNILSVGDDLSIIFQIKFRNSVIVPVKMSVELKASDGTRLANMIDVDSNFSTTQSLPDLATIRVTVKDIRLYPDTYYLSLYAGDMSSTEPYDYVEDCVNFKIISGGNLTTRTLPRAAGLLFLTPQWEVE